MVKGFVTILTVIVVSVGLAFFAGCESDAQTGAAIGSLAGAGAAIPPAAPGAKILAGAGSRSAAVGSPGSPL